MRIYPGYAQDGATSARLTGTAYLGATDLTAPINVGVGATVTRGPFMVAGFSSFMLIWTLTTASTVRFEYAHADPETGVALLPNVVVASLVGAATGLMTFGAFAVVGASDTFISIRLRFVHTAGVAAVINPAALWMSAR